MKGISDFIETYHKALITYYQTGNYTTYSEFFVQNHAFFAEKLTGKPVF